jgi:hypothetical protein
MYTSTTRIHGSMYLGTNIFPSMRYTSWHITLIVEEHFLFLFGFLMNYYFINLIQVDIGGYPPIPTGIKQSSGNLLFLAGFRFLNFRGHFEGLNDIFWEIEHLNDGQRL